MAEVLEAMETSDLATGRSYLVVVRLVYRGIRSRPFSIPAKDMGDLINKLKIEVSKLKFMELVMGLPEVRRLIT